MNILTRSPDLLQCTEGGGEPEARHSKKTSTPSLTRICCGVIVSSILCSPGENMATSVVIIETRVNHKIVVNQKEPAKTITWNESKSPNFFNQNELSNTIWN